MGWLFGRKKVVPRVPFPQGRALDEKALEFPSMDSSDRVIEPDKVKEAVGFSKPMAFPEEEESMPMPEEEAPETPRFPFAPMPKYNRTAAAQELMPKHELYVKVEVYQRMLSELDELRRGFVDLQQINKSMGESEYNEETNFNKLRRGMKTLHDNLLQADKILFKSQGD
ncbi:MAG TPA: hypothetical protein VJB13_02070 [Candidatus Nanoarchaeia archaeon]|nr:hypothetical protein [Candidatus Nanoarchaeia archaeon]